MVLMKVSKLKEDLGNISIMAKICNGCSCFISFNTALSYNLMTIYEQHHYLSPVYMMFQIPLTPIR